VWCNWVCSCVSLCVSEVWLKRQNVNRPRPLTTFKCLPSTKSHGLPVILRRLWRRYLALPELLQVLFSDTESSIVVFPNVVDSNPLYVNFVVICIKWMKLTSKFNCAHKPTSTILNTLCALIAQRSVLAPVLVHRATILCVLWLHSGLYLALCWCTGPQYFVCFDCTAVCTWPCAGAQGHNTLCALIAKRSVLGPVLVHRATILCVLWLHSGLYLAMCWCTWPITLQLLPQLPCLHRNTS